MAPLTPYSVPRNFPAGTTVRYNRSFDDFLPSDSWTYTIYLNGLTAKFNKAAASTDGTAFSIEFVPADTAALPPGPYRYAERLTKPATTFVLTGVSAPDANGFATFSFSSSSGPAPVSGALITVAGFANAGNNITGALDAIDSGSFTMRNPTAVAETAAATGTIAAETYDIRGDELVINIEPNVATSAAGTFNTWEETTLAVVEAAIAGRLTNDIQSYQIAGRAVNKIPIEELRKIRGQLKNAIWQQTHPGQLGKPFKIEFTEQGERLDYPATWTDVTGLQQ
jgi:hypothetical protein